MTIRNQSVLTMQEGPHAGLIVAAQDHFAGEALRVFPRRHPVGEIVRSGAINTHAGEPCLDRKFWRVIGHTTWHQAKKIARAAHPTDCRLAPGVWHVVISD